METNINVSEDRARTFAAVYSHAVFEACIAKSFIKHLAKKYDFDPEQYVINKDEVIQNFIHTIIPQQNVNQEYLDSMAEELTETLLKIPTITFED